MSRLIVPAAIGSLLLLVGIALIAACGGSSPSATVNVSEKEWSIAPDVAEAKGGSVKFNVTNNGTEPHEFLIFKTDLAADGLAGTSDAINEDSLTKVEDSVEGNDSC